MNKKIVFFILLLLVSSVYGTIDVLEYSSNEDKDEILYEMNLIIADLENLGYNSDRLQDIYDQSLEHSGSEFYIFASEFRSITYLAHKTIREHNGLRVKKSILNKHNISIDDINKTLFEAEENIRYGRYEDAQNYLDEVQIEIEEKSVFLFTRALEKVEQLEKKEDEISTKSLEDIRKRIIVARDLNDLVSLDNLFDELNKIEVSQNMLNDIELYIDYFEKKDIRAQRVTDIMSQMNFFYENGRFNDISSLHKEARNIYNNALEFERKYKSVKSEVEKTNEQRFNVSLQTAYEVYQNGEFESASRQLETLNDELIDYKSSRVASANLRTRTINLWNLIRENGIYIIGGLFFLLFIGLILSKGIRIRINKKRIKILKEEKEELERFMKELQDKYYAKKDMSKKTYEQKFKQSQKRFVEVTKELDILEQSNNLLNND